MKNETIKLEEKIKKHREHTKVRSKLRFENLSVTLEELKFRYENANSILDYVLGLFQQFLALSATGYLGLLVVPENILKKDSGVQQILLWIMLFSILAIIALLILKFKLSHIIDSVIDKRMKVYNDILKMEDECETFTHEKLDHIADLEEEGKHKEQNS